LPLFLFVKYVPFISLSKGIGLPFCFLIRLNELLHFELPFSGGSYFFHFFIALHKVGCVINNKFTLCAEVSEMSSRLTSDTRIYADKAKDLNRQVIDICCVQFMACTLAC